MGVTGALLALLENRSEIFARCLSRRRYKGLVGLPANAKEEYEPFQVERLFSGVVGNWDARRGEGKEKGRIWGSEANTDFMGEGGAYISDNWESSDGDVSAENSCRMLSQCVCVVCKHECRATRTEEDVEGPEELYIDR